MADKAPPMPSTPGPTHHPPRIYLWDAGDFLGVTDDANRAKAAAAACITDGETARIERARVVEAQGGYERLGTGWTGRLCDDRVMWTAGMLAAAA